LGDLDRIVKLEDVFRILHGDWTQPGGILLLLRIRNAVVDMGQAGGKANGVLGPAVDGPGEDKTAGNLPVGS
jgi:hypothetical protein